MSEEKTKDVVLPVGPSDEDGSFPAVRMSDDGTVGIGRFTPFRDGRPLEPGTELVHLSRREGSLAMDLEVLYRTPGPQRGPGPAMVNSREYRSGWDDVFGAGRGRVAPN